MYTSTAVRTKCLHCSKFIKRGESAWKCDKCGKCIHDTCLASPPSSSSPFLCHKCFKPVVDPPTSIPQYIQPAIPSDIPLESAPSSLPVPNTTATSTPESAKRSKRSRSSPSPTSSSQRTKTPRTLRRSNSTSDISTELTMGDEGNEAARSTVDQFAPFLNDPSVPPYMVGFYNYMKSRFDASDSRFDRQERSQGAALSDLRSELRSDICASRILVDPCEIRFGGIPDAVISTDRETVSSILDSMGCADVVGQIIFTRPWAPKNKNQNQNDASNTRGIVAQFSSGTVRDLVKSKSIKLKDKTAQMIFGLGGDAKINAYPIYPKETHSIWIAARDKASELNYARPVVTNGVTVCMRQTRNSPLIPILKLQDLDSLAPVLPDPEGDREMGE